MTEEAGNEYSLGDHGSPSPSPDKVGNTGNPRDGTKSNNYQTRPT